MRSAIISYNYPAWETWHIDITDPNAPEEITPEWLEANPDSWEYFDLKDRGEAGPMSDLTVEDFDALG